MVLSSFRQKGINMKTLIVYYSYGHHTKDVAEMMKKVLGCDIAEIVPVKPYTDVYQELVDATENNREMKNTPEINPISLNICDYDIIIIGTPVWWYTMAEPVRTFLSQNNLTGKKVVIYATNAGWIGSTFKDMKELIGRMDIHELDVMFSVDGESMLTEKCVIEQFVKKL